jgi:polysaccharide export outer membrane protein
MKNLVCALFLLLLLAPHLAVAGYQIGDGDVLRINVYSHPDLDAVARVSAGAVNIPLVGTVKIGGLTVEQAGAQIAGLLAEGFLVNPHVTVFIQEFRSNRVTIMGQVKNPGLYELSGATTVLELISKAGGLTAHYGETVTIHRRTHDSAEEKVLAINLKRLVDEGEASLDLAILDGDNVVVSQAGVFYVTGEVRRPDAYKLEDGITVLKAITKAGGFTASAARKQVKIIRTVDGREQVLERVAMHDVLQAGDVMVVPASFF